MVINENNSAINSFTKGMNSDGAYDQLDGAQYTFALNVRITKNLFLGGKNDYASVHEGIITPVPSGLYVDYAKVYEGTILAVKSIDNIAIVITSTGSYMNIYRFDVDESLNRIIKDYGEIWSNVVWDSSSDAPKQVSAVLYKELDNVIKLYIATGSHPIMCMRVDDEALKTLNPNAPVDDFMSNRVVPNKRIVIEGITSGRLLTSQVQYTYRYYNKYGNSTQLAPLTNKIQVIDPSRSKEIGNAENTETSLGFILSIDTTDYKNFDRLQVYRVLYIKPVEDAEVSLIYDGDLKKNTNKFVFNDVGVEPILSLTMEEFSAMSGIIVIPKTIEQNQEYMFCGNVKDDTILRDVNIPSSYEIDENKITFTKAKVSLSTATQGDIPSPSNAKYASSTEYNTLQYDSSITLANTVTTTVTDYFKQRGISSTDVKASYQDIITSSLLRSLRRGEKYKYAIVFYDKYGRRSDVLPLGEKTAPTYSESEPFTCTGQKLDANPLGVNIKIPQVTDSDGNLIKDIVGCLIIRRSSSDVYQETLLLVALARPIQQGILDINVSDWQSLTDDGIKKSPFYPSGFMSVNNLVIFPTYYLAALDESHASWTDESGTRHKDEAIAIYRNMPTVAKDALNASTKNRKLYLIFSQEIDLRRDDVLSRINTSDTKIKEVAYIPAIFSMCKNSSKTTYDNSFPDAYFLLNGTIRIDRNKLMKLSIEDKLSLHMIFNFYRKSSLSLFGEQDVNAIKDIKMADWDSGFTNVNRAGDDQNVFDAIKKYKSYTTNIDSFSYNNWASFAKYNFDPGTSKSANMLSGNEDVDNSSEHQELLGISGSYTYWLDPSTGNRYDMQLRKGPIGPGPSCFLLTTENESGSFGTSNKQFSTCICNIKHTPKTLEIKSEEYELYFGFGNYFSLKYTGTGDKRELVTQDNKKYLTVFDGDIYITPHEFTTMYKTYNFESVDTLQSTLITNYIPLESKINTFFDYGMNLMNTQSENLLYEPGSIEGVTTQERPAHQYNMVYSDNDSSNDVFTMISTDKNETNNFKQRAYYSELKNNGEFIDNFLIYKAAAFIDVDSKYGQITNMLTDRNTLYYWQDTACGKFSVNERSLVNDQNSNTIMLGQSGILSRYDYLSTRYGMREQDFCAVPADNGVYWVDINNKAIVLLKDLVVNYGELLNVLNIINNNLSTDIPKINYDLQNSELVCKCFGNKEIVFNTKYNVATSLYTRDYDAMLDIKNHQYGLKFDSSANRKLDITKYNYLPYGNYSYLSPLKLEFIVNPSASVTKVFDSQQIIPIKRDSYSNSGAILNGVQMAFETDITSKTFGSSMEPYTDREGNIIYNVPRFTNELGYGCRMRGKWMRVEINNNAPTELFTLSHIITKFRQSFS